MANGSPGLLTETTRQEDDDSQRGLWLDDDISKSLIAQMPSPQSSIKDEITDPLFPYAWIQTLRDEQARQFRVEQGGMFSEPEEQQGMFWIERIEPGPDLWDYYFPELEYGKTSPDSPKYFAPKEYRQRSSEVLDLKDFDMSELMDINTFEQQAYVFNENKESDWAFTLGIPMGEIPPPPETCTSESHYASPSNEFSAGDGSFVGQHTEMRSIKKRTQEELIGDDTDSEAESRSGWKKAKHSSDDHDSKTDPLLFACPFLKRYPLKHRDCSKYVFKRVRDVKQHLNRSHRTPEFYCARCYDVFLGAKERDEHTRDMQCQVHPNRRFEGITEEQKEELMQNKGHKKSHQEQWFMIWDIIFPGISHPTSVYRYNPHEEAVELLRDMWKTKHRELLADVNQADHLIHFLMEKLFDRLEAELRIPNPPARKMSKQQSRIVAAPDYVNVSAGGALSCEEPLDKSLIPVTPPGEAGYQD